MPLLPDVFDAAAHAALSNLEVALDLAARGFAVFPCRPDGPEAKRPYPGIPWRQASSTDPRRIGSWWQMHPDAVPALDIAKTDLIVIDLDGDAGFADWATLAGGRDPDGPFVDTPSGGRHLYFRRDGWHHGNGRGSLPPKGKKEGIDVRGSGGYVIAPGATMLDGRRYEPDGDPLGDAPAIPAWLREVLSAKEHAPQKMTIAETDSHSTTSLQKVQTTIASDDRKRAYGEEALTREVAALASTFAGGRNEALNRAAFALGQLVAGGCLDEGRVRQALTGACEDNGLRKDDGPRQVNATITSGLRAGARDPRGPPEKADDLGAHGATIAARLLERDDRTILDTTTGEILPTRLDASEADGELPEALTRVPGILGEITDWICDTARRPQRALALGAALTILGTACGRHLAGPTNSGTHLYVIGLAPTGAGKDHALQQISEALRAANMPQHIGPSQFISMPAVINFLYRAPLALCAMDEFGSFMKRINGKRASGFEGAISGVLRTAWGTSFRPLTTPEWAGRASETIVAPALSIYGASTPEEFYGALDGADMSNGVLNRLLVIETRSRPEDRDPLRDPFDVPARVSDGIREVYTRMGPLIAGQLNRPDSRPDVHRMPWGPRADAAYRALVDSINRRCDGDAMAQAFYARTAEMAVRMATIRAAGIYPRGPELDEESMQWGAELALWSAKVMARGAMDHVSESENQSAAQLVRRTIREAGTITRRDLFRRIRGRIKQRDLEEILKALGEAGEIESPVPETPPSGGKAVKKYTFLG